MSRSMKKNPSWWDRKGKDKKRIANHHVRSWLKRHPEELLQRAAYKDIHERWDICDYGGFFSLEESIQKEWNDYLAYLNGGFPHYERWYGHSGPPNKKEIYKEWLKSYKVK